MPDRFINGPLVVEVLVPGAQGPKGGWDNDAPFYLTAVNVSPVGGVLTLDLSEGNTFNVFLNANVTSVVFTGWPPAPATQRVAVYFQQDTVGSRSVAGWPAGMKWAAGNVYTPTPSANAVDVVVFDSFTAGSTIFAAPVGYDYR